MAKNCDSQTNTILLLLSMTEIGFVKYMNLRRKIELESNTYIMW